MNNPYYEIKKEQKELASKIRKEGSDYDSYIFRHKHIAYCELRGRERFQIENPREGNEPSERLIEQFKTGWETEIADWRKEHEKALCDIN